MIKTAENVKNGSDLLLLQQGEALLKNVAYQTQLSDVKEENLELKQALAQSQAENATLRKMVEDDDVDRLTLLLRLGESREDGAKLKVQLELALTKITSLRQELISAAIDSCALLDALQNERFYIVTRGLHTSNVKLVHIMEGIQVEMESESS
ncbi:hypothetical protein NLG97_g5486 [Lecanicillium saksenae]|uniref:Uncharacterized protein n=1 Tax=Lecanicillium saksenae TaxID=468837 RepID=A0ACC1QVH6_9HYPO|nr:hypothetical protein NLG97_g5486 [Lecanicillium saksenae]